MSAEAYKFYRERIDKYVDSEARKAYYQTDAPRTIVRFAAIWFVLALSFAAIYALRRQPLWAEILAAPFVILLIGSRINALAVQVHEASHISLMRRKRVNDLFCNFFGAYWALNDVGSYWALHRDHHSYLHDEKDPDFVLYDLPRHNPRGMVLLLIQDFFWISAAKRILAYLRHQSSSKKQQTSSTKLMHLVFKLGAQGIVVGLFVAAFGPVQGLVSFGVYWCIPLFSIFTVMIRMRLATEHYSELLYDELPYRFVSRTSLSNFLEEYFVGAGMEYHMEHHLFPKMPYHQLKRFHRELADKGFFEEMDSERPNIMSGGYIHFWRSVFADAPMHQSTDPVST